MIYYIRVPDDPKKKEQVNGLLNGLEEFYSLATYNVIAVVLDGDDHLEPLFDQLAEHSYSTDAEKVAEAIRKPKPEKKPAKAEKPAKVCVECGGPNTRRSKFCSSACYQRDWTRRHSQNEPEPKPEEKPAKPKGATVITDERSLSGIPMTGRKVA